MLNYNDHLLLKRNISDNIDIKSTITAIMCNISAYSDNNECYTYKGIINVIIEPLQREDSIKVIISNSQFDHMTQRILYINDNSNTTKCIIRIISCTFKSIVNDKYNALIEVEVPLFTTTLIFLKCKFHNNTVRGSLVSVTDYHYSNTNFAAHRNVMCTSITFSKCNFTQNSGTVLYLSSFNQPNLSVSFIYIGLDLNYWLDTYVEGIMFRIYNLVVHIHGPFNILNNIALWSSLMEFNSCTMYITGPITISDNMAGNIIFLHSCTTLFQGPITISSNSANSVMLLEASDVTFSKKIIFISNKSIKIITIEAEYPYIKVMQHANITFASNVYSLALYFIAFIKYNNPYPFCVFQYTVAKDILSTVKSEDYTITFSNNIRKNHQLTNRCTLTFVHFTSHCKWINSSVFHGHNPGLINQKIIQLDQDQEQINHHTFICPSNLQSHYDCGIDTLGYVYPGQKLRVTLFTPCSGNTSVVFAETHNKLLPSTACKIAHQTELLIVSIITQEQSLYYCFRQH